MCLCKQFINRIDIRYAKYSIKSQKGTTLVEFAIIVPLLFFLIFPIIEFGIYFYNNQVITNASREGARFGIVYTNPKPRVSSAEIRQKVNDYCQSNLITFGNANNLNIEIDPNADNLRVTVTFDYGYLFLPFMPEVMEAETIMRYE